jgi:hypothetical protein
MIAGTRERFFKFLPIQEEHAMMTDTFVARLKRLHQRLNGSSVRYDLTPYFNKLAEIKNHESNLRKKTSGQLKQISRELAAQAQKEMKMKLRLLPRPESGLPLQF